VSMPNSHGPDVTKFLPGDGHPGRPTQPIQCPRATIGQTKDLY